MSLETTKLVSRNQSDRPQNGDINHRSTAFYDPHLSDYESAGPVLQESAIAQESFAKSIILGGIDGLSASYLIIAAAAGAQLHWSYFLILGFSSILATSVSIGISEFFSSKLHREYILAEKRRATWQYKNYRDEEIREMSARLEKRGMSRQDADLVVNRIALYEDIFVNYLLVEELGMNLPDEDDGSSITDAIIMLVSHALFGSMPVLVYALGMKIDRESDNDMLFLLSTSVTLILLVILGSIKSRFSSSHWAYAATETVCTTGVCAAAAYFLARVVTYVLSDYQ